jgi:pullulanase/glycogen debranching enzyme
LPPGARQLLGYILDEDGSRYADYTGCGNTLNANHPIVHRMIVDSLRYWVEEMHVDGFRFDLASILARDLNRSWNSGVEGPTDDPAVERLRNRQVKSYLTATMMSLGVPMILMGDEVRRTHKGNNKLVRPALVPRRLKQRWPSCLQ